MLLPPRVGDCVTSAHFIRRGRCNPAGVAYILSCLQPDFKMFSVFLARLLFAVYLVSERYIQQKQEQHNVSETPKKKDVRKL